MAQFEPNLRDYWQIIRRRRMIIVASTVLVALFSFWFAKQKVPFYQAVAAVKFEQSTQMSGLLVEVLSYSSADSIERAEDRERFAFLLDRIGIPQPEWGSFRSMKQAREFCDKVGYPVIVRPSHVLSGSAMRASKSAFSISGSTPMMLITRVML